MTDPDQDDGTSPNASSNEIETAQLTRDITRGVTRLFADMDMASVTEMTLANGRRADVVALDRTGLITVVEVKASVADYRGDRKWGDYKAFCDRFYFAVAPSFPRDILPPQTDCGSSSLTGMKRSNTAPLQKKSSAPAGVP